MKLKLMSKLAAMIVLMGFAVMVNAQTESDAVEALKDGAAKTKAKDYVNAIASFKKCVSIYDDLDLSNSENRNTAAAQITKTQFKYAYSLFKAKKYDESIKEFTTLEDYSKEYKDPDNLKKAKAVIPQLYYFKGKELAEKKDFDGAIESYKMAIELKSNYFDPYFRLAEIYADQNNDALFKQSIEKASELASKPDKKEAAKALAIKYYNNNGVKALGSENYDEALGYFNALLKYESNNSDIYYQMAVIYNKQSKWGSAIEQAKKALELFKDQDANKNAKIYYELGLAYYGNGDNTAACDAFNKANKGDYAQSAEYQIKNVVKCQ